MKKKIYLKIFQNLELQIKILCVYLNIIFFLILFSFGSFSAIFYFILLLISALFFILINFVIKNTHDHFWFWFCRFLIAVSLIVLKAYYFLVLVLFLSFIDFLLIRSHIILQKKNDTNSIFFIVLNDLVLIEALYKDNFKTFFYFKEIHSIILVEFYVLFMFFPSIIFNSFFMSLFVGSFLFWLFSFCLLTYFRSLIIDINVLSDISKNILKFSNTSDYFVSFLLLFFIHHVSSTSGFIDPLPFGVLYMEHFVFPYQDNYFGFHARTGFEILQGKKFRQVFLNESVPVYSDNYLNFLECSRRLADMPVITHLVESSYTVDSLNYAPFLIFFLVVSVVFFICIYNIRR